METKLSICAIGDRESVMVFHAVGIQTKTAKTKEETEAALQSVLQADCKVVYITETCASMIEPIIEEYKSQQVPMIIPIPSRTGSSGYGMKRVYENAEKATGMNIFENEE